MPALSGSHGRSSIWAADAGCGVVTRILAEERNQRVTVDAAEGVTVTADRLVLREAITNVIDNAIKYSPRASSIRIRVYSDGTTCISPLETKARDRC